MGKDQGAKGCFNKFPQGNVPGGPQKDCRSPESALGKVASRKEGLDSGSIAVTTQLLVNVDVTPTIPLSYCQLRQLRGFH
jgi:hypothetical protein